MARIINKIKSWLSWNAPRIITGRGLFEKLVSYDTECQKTEKEFNWKVIRPVIHELETLRSNTWDQDKITHIQDCLRYYFEVKDEEC